VSHTLCGCRAVSKARITRSLAEGRRGVPGGEPRLSRGGAASLSGSWVRHRNSFQRSKTAARRRRRACAARRCLGLSGGPRLGCLANQPAQAGEVQSVRRCQAAAKGAPDSASTELKLQPGMARAISGINRNVRLIVTLLVYRRQKMHCRNLPYWYYHLPKAVESVGRRGTGMSNRERLVLHNL